MKGFILGLGLLISILNIPLVTQCAESMDEMKRIEELKREMDSLRARLEERKRKRERIERIEREIADIIEREGKERAKTEIFKIVEGLMGIKSEEWRIEPIKIEELDKIKIELDRISKRIEDAERLKIELANERMEKERLVLLKNQEIEKVKQEVASLTHLLEEERKKLEEERKKREKVKRVDKPDKEMALLIELEEERRKRIEAEKEAEDAKLEIALLTKRFEGEIESAKKEILELSEMIEVYEKKGVGKGVSERLKRTEKEVDRLTKKLEEERRKRIEAEEEIKTLTKKLDEERRRREKEKEEAIEMAKKEIELEEREHVIPKKLPPSEEGPILSPGDKIQIVVKGHSDLTQTLTISQQGIITLPLIGEIYAAGLTPEKLSEIITYKLEKDYIVNPQVTVTMEAEVGRIPRTYICILGGVHRPGLYAYHENMTIMHAIAMAGGVTDKAILKKVKVVREKGGREEVIWVDYDKFMRKGDRRENILLKPDDFIIIPESLF